MFCTLDDLARCGRPKTLEHSNSDAGINHSLYDSLRVLKWCLCLLLTGRLSTRWLSIKSARAFFWPVLYSQCLPEQPCLTSQSLSGCELHGPGSPRACTHCNSYQCVHMSRCLDVVQAHDAPH